MDSHELAYKLLQTGPCKVVAFTGTAEEEVTGIVYGMEGEIELFFDNYLEEDTSQEDEELGNIQIEGEE